jgi:hypothetical protein
VGRAAIRSWIDGFLGAFRCEFALDVQEVRVDGEWAFERGGYRIVLRPKAGAAPMQDMGKAHYDLPAAAGWSVEDGAGHLEQRHPGATLMGRDQLRQELRIVSALAQTARCW